MVLVDPAEEIRRLVEEEDIPRDEARARVREDLRKRKAVIERTQREGIKRPKQVAQYQWTNRARRRGQRSRWGS